MTVIAVSILATLALVVLYIRWPRSAIVRWHLRFLDGLTVVGATIAFVGLMGLLYYEFAVAVVEALVP